MAIQTHRSNHICFSAIRKFSDQSLFFNAYALVASNLVTAFSGYLFWVIVARRFDDEIVGVASAVISSMALIELVTNLGLGAGLIRFLADCKDEAEIKQTVNFSLTVRLGTVAVGALVFIMGLNIWAPRLLILQSQPILSMTFVTLAISNGLFTLLTSLFIAIRKSHYVFLMSLVYNTLKILLALLSAVSLGLFSLMMAFLLPIIFSIQSSGILYLFRSKAHYTPGLSFTFRRFTRFFTYSVSNQFADSVITFPQLIMPIIVLNMLGPEANAHFYVALMTAGILRTISLSISQSAFAEGAATPHKLYKHTHQSFFLSILTVFAIGTAIFVLAPALLNMFGQNYAQQGTLILRWLLMSVFPFTAINHLIITVFRVRLNIRLLVLTSLGWAVLNLAGAVIGIHKAELLGVAIGWLIGQLVAAALYFSLYLHKRSN